MSGNRYFSESASTLSFRRIRVDAVDVDPDALRKVIDTAQQEGLPESMIAPLQQKLKEISSVTQLTEKEVEVLKQAIAEASLSYYGLKADKRGLYFEDGGEGNLYGADESLQHVFNSVKDTVLFSGTVEIWGAGIYEYQQLHFEDSLLINSKTAEIKWV